MSQYLISPIATLSRLVRQGRGHFALLPTLHQALIAVLAALVVLLMTLPSGTTLAARHTQDPALDSRHPVSLPVALPSDQAEVPKQPPSPQPELVTGPMPEHDLGWQTLTVRPGDSLARMFNRAGLSARLVHDIDQLETAGPMLRALRPGQKLELGLDGSTFKALRYQPDQRRTLAIHQQQDSLTERLEEKSVEVRQSFARATIRNNFWNAALDVGLSANQIMRLAGIFGWDVDFALDIREGDAFAVLYEQEYLDGHLAGDGDILAAEFTNQGHTFRAVRHSDGNYYDDKGRAMRKAFLRAPVQFNYVSSNFNPRRLHPVTGQIKAHRGTDYVAPRGTPIMAAGDGVVTASAYSKYNGNYVFIKHSNTYVTKYLHLTKRKVKKGQRVKQGQTIGTLGSTGRVTGAHLHYEFLVNGVHRNPRTVKLPESGPVAKTERAEFDRLKTERLGQLALHQQVMMAMP